MVCFATFMKEKCIVDIPLYPFLGNCFSDIFNGAGVNGLYDYLHLHFGFCCFGLVHNWSYPTSVLSLSRKTEIEKTALNVTMLKNFEKWASDSSYSIQSKEFLFQS